MKAEDFRIGNLVYYIDRNGVVHTIIEQPIQISKISLLEVVANLYKPSDNKGFNVRIKDLSPIPLTEEILLNCGFKNTDTGFLILLPNGTQLSLIKIRDKYSVGLSGPFGLVQPLFIQHLHELQNLYSGLTLKEMEVNL